MQSTLAKIGIGAGVVELIALIFGILWMTVIYSRFERVPTDLERIVELEGEYTIIDPFATILSENETLPDLLASGAGADLLANNAIRAILGSAGVQKVIANPQLLALVRDPAALALLGSGLQATLTTDPDIPGATP